MRKVFIVSPKEKSQAGLKNIVRKLVITVYRKNTYSYDTSADSNIAGVTELVQTEKITLAIYATATDGPVGD